MSLSFCPRVSNWAGSCLKALIPKSKGEVLGLGGGLLTASLYSTPLGLAVGVGYGGYKWLTSKKVIPLPLGFVYHPDTRLTNEDLRNVAEKVENLKQRADVLGFAAVAEKATGNKVPVYISVQANEHKGLFTIHRVNDDRRLGWADLHLFLKENDFENADYLASIPSQKIYGRERMQQSKNHLDRLYNEKLDSYKNVGYLLIKAIHQCYADKCEARMDVGAGYNSHTFYYNLGYRAISVELDDRISEAYETFHSERIISDTSQLKEVEMYLPLEARENWLKAIQENPISKHTARG